jgi:branched-chain amino acid transport system permease protein
VGALRTTARSLLPFAIGLVVFAILQRQLSPSQTIILIIASVNVILAVSLNVVNGFTGQFSLGHAGFMAIGAYTAAKITTAMVGMQIVGLSAVVSDQVVFLLALVAGMIMAGVMGLVVGLPSLRLRGDYLAIVTLGFNEIIRVIIENTKFLGEATGISGLPRLTTITWVGMGALATVAMARRLVGSSHGRALLSIREDEIAAEAMGVDTTGYKVRAFVISSAFAGLAGGLLVHLIQLCTPRSFTFVKSIEVVAMVVLGGMGSVTGSVVAALTLTFALEALRGVQQYRMVMYAFLLIVLMLTRPSGIFGTREIWDILPGLFRRKGTPPGSVVEPGAGNGDKLS